MKRKKRSALFSTTISLLLCVAMLAGTTFAWFTDTVTSSINRIAAGNLDIELEYLSDGKWKSVQDSTNVFNKDALWEPGHTEVVYLRISNAGELALKYQLGVHITKETGSINAKGNPFVLSDYIEFSAIKDVKTPYASREDARKAAASSSILSAGYNQQDSMLPGGEPHYVALVVYMPENVGNDANHATGVEAPHIELGIHLFATQQTHESDSFGNSYDTAVEFPLNNVNVTVAAPIHNNAENGVIASAMSVGNTGSGITATIPQGVALDDGANALTLSVKSLETSEANIALQQGESKTSLDIHIDGVAADNTVPMLITLDGYFPTGLNSTSVALYHVENGVTLQMTPVTNPTNHNEFSYDPATGDVTVAMASFSEVVAVANQSDPWNGTAASAFNGGTGTVGDPYIIANEDQFAYFRNEVDNGRTFKDEFVQLAVNLDLNNINFDPIGWGYAYSGHNRGGAEGKVFMGTFDGNHKTIFNLKQNGWDLESATRTDYTYTNCGMGLFASIADGAVKNLTISGADIVAECVEMGVLVGLSQGTCTYENINIYNSKIANYQRPAGGLIGEVSGGGTTYITNVVIRSDVVVGSLWGDFDAPVGGVIGARWDDSTEGSPFVTMDTVTVACELDVYNDVTSTYQWYAYRRAGMLIGNTDMSAKNENGTNIATADFLTCSNVNVYYGPWVDYHYCQFTNYKPSWPWVRVEAGENCDAYSNPRYGVPNDISGNKVTDAHTTANHQTGDLCRELIEFNQLYGGGQGVYGQAKHDGVTVESYAYSIQYINDNKVLAETFVESNDSDFILANDRPNYSTAKDAAEKWVTDQGYNVEFGGWVNAGSTKVTKIRAGNTETIKLYPYFNSPYTARFVDQNGNVLAWCLFHSEKLTDLETARVLAEKALTLDDDFSLDYWEVHVGSDKATYSVNNFASYTQDVTIYPVYKFNGDVSLIPVDSEGDGDTDYYEVGGYSNPSGQALVEIPGVVNGIKVTEINASAFASFDGVHSIVIPATVEKIGDNAFAEAWGTFRSGETITIYYAGSYEDWIEKEKNFASNWESGVSSSTRIFFLNGGETVDASQGYLQAEVNNNWGTKTVSWTQTTITSAMTDEYTGHCDCKISTTGDDAHIYVDASGNIMRHNENGTPVNGNGAKIYLKESGLFNKTYTLTDGTYTYYRYRPDIAYWENVTVS